MQNTAFTVGQIVWAASGERRGNPIDCPPLDTYRTSRGEAIADAKEWLNEANDPACDAYVRPYRVVRMEDDFISESVTCGPADWRADLDSEGNMLIRDDAPEVSNP